MLPQMMPLPWLMLFFCLFLCFTFFFVFISFSICKSNLDPNSISFLKLDYKKMNW
uniref:ATP synthase F0 subunit 8 n=1 Tax=Ardeacarus ardeae TaxID=1932962 RepID=A0A343BSH7_9ACAR|nr:ATP synthase F0 subunit 8 [Ardeacarus ardeae]